MTISVDDVLDTWSFCAPQYSGCNVDADGVRPASNTVLGTYSSTGFAFAYGTLVGRIGLGDFFAVGTTGFSGAANASGRLSLFHWDHNTNNGGSIAATVSYSPSPVPLPAGLPLLLGGLAAIWVARRRRRKPV